MRCWWPGPEPARFPGARQAERANAVFMLSAQLFSLEPVWSPVHRHRRIRGCWFRAVGAPLAGRIAGALGRFPQWRWRRPRRRPRSWRSRRRHLERTQGLAPRLPNGSARTAGASSNCVRWRVPRAWNLWPIAVRCCCRNWPKRALSPEQLVVQEDPPYSMIGVIDAKGQFKPYLAVDDRAGRAFESSRQ